jgi:putative ABC transport system permease protein
MGITLIQGRNFSKEMRSDSAAAIINQTMAKELGLENPIGHKIENGWEKFTIVGVVADFNFELMKQTVGPLSMVLGNNRASIVSVKISGANARDAIASISAVWKNFAPDQPFRYTFMDESFADMYDDVQRTGRIFTSFAVFAIIIACLGLFALSAFMAEQRRKEIGIRKVLGASVNGIVSMLSKDFVKLVLIAVVIASPISWWVMSTWLQDFAYRINISWYFFLVAGALALLIAITTVSFQSIKAAIANPVKSLRTE